MALIKGIAVTLVNLVEDGTDEFNNPVYTEERHEVKNVLVAPVSSEEVVNITNQYGRTATYQIAIPKGDSHMWENQIVEFFGKRWRIFGLPQMGIEENIPLEWNAKYWCDRYE